MYFANSFPHFITIYIASLLLILFYKTILVYFHSDKPGPPEGPLNFDEVDKDHVKLSWKPPKDDGGSPLTLVFSLLDL